MVEPQVTIHPVASLDRSAFLEAINAAYSDYFVSIYLSAAAFNELVQRESVALGDSLAALCEGEIVGMGLLGVRGQRGWVGGMGVIPAFRQKGIGRRILNGLIERARRLGLETLQLEVITQNHAARALYDSSGFLARRRLSVLSCSQPSAATHDAHAPGLAIRQMKPAEALALLAGLPAPHRPWQREMGAHEAILPQLKALVARERSGDQAVGVCLVRGDGHHKDITDIAATTPDVGFALASHLLRHYPASGFSYLNVAEEDPLLPVLRRAGFQTIVSQVEMFLPLSQESQA